MGCVFSSIDDEERVRICKERKKLMKHLVNIRRELSDAQLAYLKALRNTGVALRQFTESESLELETSSNGLVVPPSPPLPWALSPPPPPFDTDSRTLNDKTMADVNQMENLENEEDIYYQKSETTDLMEEDNYVETRSHFEDDDMETEAITSDVVNPFGEKQQVKEKNMPMGRSKKMLDSIMQQLDDHFLSASAGVKEINILIDINGGDALQWQNPREQKRKRSKSTKVFSVLSRSRHSKSPQLNRDAAMISEPCQPCMPGAHCVTLKKLYAAEKRLCKDVKEEEITKLEFERKSLLLQKQEDENFDFKKVDKTRASVENLQSDVIRLQESISQTTSSIVQLINEELYPQLVALTSGLTSIWRTMFKCHRAQTKISQLLSHLSDPECTIQNSEYHHQATIQLETELSYWYNTFCKLTKSQREYAQTLCSWIKLTNCLMDGNKPSESSSKICSISEQWERGLDQLLTKAVSDAMTGLLLSIRSIHAQQAEQDTLLKKVSKFERRLQKESEYLEEMGRKFEWSFDAEDMTENLSPKHPLSLQCAKTDALKKQLEAERTKYLNSIQVTRDMTLKSLKTKLPLLFESLMVFSKAFAMFLEAGNSQDKPAESSDIASQN